MAWRSEIFSRTAARLALLLVASATLLTALALPSTAHAKARWAGPFLILGPGYSTKSGEMGVPIPDTTGGTGTATKLSSLPKEKYDAAVRTDKGNGVGLDLQLGYNILGFASIWADLAWHGSFGSSLETAGTGSGALMVGLHPLRLIGDDLSIDVRVFGGYGLYEINHYNEDGTQAAVKGKAWTGNNITLGGSFEYRLTDSAISFGVDVRQVFGRYNTWVYNFDNDIRSQIDESVHKDRFEAHATIGFHL